MDIRAHGSRFRTAPQPQKGVDRSEIAHHGQAGDRDARAQANNGIWLLSFMHYDLKYIDLEQGTLQTIDNPFGTRLSPMS